MYPKEDIVRYQIVLIVLLSIYTGCSDDTTQQTDTYGDKLGTVNFPVSGNNEAMQHIERAVALLHHMTYDDADKAFAAAIEADPDCAMGYWGRAMAYIHPLWQDLPSEEMLKRGRELVEEAKTRGRKTAREQAYIDALEAYYRDAENRSEPSRLADFAEGWKRVYEQFPDDLEEEVSIYEYGKEKVLNKF